jgi:hypothetical protein
LPDLLLTPTIDHLFDRGFIGFESDGTLIISPVADKPSLQRRGIDAPTINQRRQLYRRPKAFLEFSPQLGVVDAPMIARICQLQGSTCSAAMLADRIT